MNVVFCNNSATELIVNNQIIKPHRELEIEIDNDATIEALSTTGSYLKTNMQKRVSSYKINVTSVYKIKSADDKVHINLECNCYRDVFRDYDYIAVCLNSEDCETELLSLYVKDKIKVFDAIYENEIKQRKSDKKWDRGFDFILLVGEMIVPIILFAVIFTVRLLRFFDTKTTFLIVFTGLSLFATVCLLLINLLNRLLDKNKKKPLNTSTMKFVENIFSEKNIKNCIESNDGLIDKL